MVDLLFYLVYGKDKKKINELIIVNVMSIITKKLLIRPFQNI
jgi:hypothetical protein